MEICRIVKVNFILKKWRNRAFKSLKLFRSVRKKNLKEIHILEVLFSKKDDPNLSFDRFYEKLGIHMSNLSNLSFFIASGT